VALNWQVVDTVTLSYCKAVAQLIKGRHAELSQVGVPQNQRQHQKNSSQGHYRHKDVSEVADALIGLASKQIQLEEKKPRSINSKGDVGDVTAKQLSKRNHASEISKLQWEECTVPLSQWSAVEDGSSEDGWKEILPW
jgi:hypothetical protein